MRDRSATGTAIVVMADEGARARVRLALQSLRLAPLLCRGAGDCRDALAGGRIHLVVADLEAAADLAISGGAQVALRANIPIVLIGAGETDSLRLRQGARAGVWLAAATISLDGLTAVLLEAAGSTARPPAASADPLWSTDPVDEAAVIERGFGGDAGLYHDFLRACQAQFPLDVSVGDRACATGDVQGLCHLTHSLKSVLRSLGRDALGDHLGAIELLAVQGDLDGAAAAWALARAGLLQLAKRPAQD